VRGDRGEATARRGLRFPGVPPLRRSSFTWRIPAAVAAAVLAVALAGCGAKPATRATVIARGNGICTNANRALADLPPSHGAAGTTIDFTRAAPIIGHEARALNGLPRPTTDRSLLDRFLAAETALAAGYRHAAAAQRSGHAGSLQSALAVLGRSDTGALARRYGLSQCGAVTATVQ
jgi:hypothetical protein